MEAIQYVLDNKDAILEWTIALLAASSVLSRLLQLAAHELEKFAKTTPTPVDDRAAEALASAADTLVTGLDAVSQWLPTVKLSGKR